MTGMMPEGAGERAVSTGWKLVILDVVNWSVFLSAAGLFYRNARKGESRIEAMREALAARDEESFYEGVREVVSGFSHRVLPGLSEERLFDEPKATESHEYYNFFHYHVMTTLSGMARMKRLQLLISGATLIGVYLMFSAFLLIVSPHPLRPRMVWAMAPMFVMMALLPAIYAKLTAVTRREADMLLAVDKRFGELVARKPEKKDRPESL